MEERKMLLKLVVLGEAGTRMLLKIFSDLDEEGLWFSSKANRNNLSGTLGIPRTSIERHLTSLRNTGILFYKKKGVYEMARVYHKFLLQFDPLKN